jgi:3-oxoisoapionate decarboxylase
MSVDALIDRAAGLGVRVVQVCDNLRWDVSRAEELRQCADAKGVELQLGGRGCSVGYLREQIDLAHRLGSRLLRIVIDTADDEPSIPEASERLRGVLGDLEAVDVSLAIENHDRFRTEQFADLIERIGSERVGICLDTVNSFGALEGPGVVIAALAKYVLNLHVKDFDLRRVDHQMGFVVEGRPAGQGRLNVPSLLASLRDAGRDPDVILELWTPPTEDLDGTIAREDRWAKQSIEYLRRHIAD